VRFFTVNANGSVPIRGGGAAMSVDQLCAVVKTNLGNISKNLTTAFRMLCGGMNMRVIDTPQEIKELSKLTSYEER